MPNIPAAHVPAALAGRMLDWEPEHLGSVIAHSPEQASGRSKLFPLTFVAVYFQPLALPIYTVKQGCHLAQLSDP